MIVKGVAQQGKLAMQTWCHIWVDFAVGSHPGSQFASFYPQQKKINSNTLSQETKKPSDAPVSELALNSIYCMQSSRDSNSC